VHKSRSAQGQKSIEAQVYKSQENRVADDWGDWLPQAIVCIHDLSAMCLAIPLTRVLTSANSCLSSSASTSTKGI